MSAIYENTEFLQVCGGAMRPGGLAMTLDTVARANLPPGATLLDVGCGAGTSVAALRDRGYDARGIDASASLVQAAGSPHVTHGDAYALPQDGYDALLYECSFSLLADKPRALASAHAALSGGGLLLISDLYPRRGAAPTGLPCLTCLNGVLPFEHLAAHLREAGFALEAFIDRADEYRQFIGTLILHYGSAQVFFEQFVADPADAAQTVASARDVKLGYFSSIWSKQP